MPKHPPFWILGLLIFTAIAHAAEKTESAVPLPLGETSLLEVGTRQIFWQSYGKDPVSMQTGGESMESSSGTAFQDQATLLGRQSLFMHSPWRVPAGKTWVDYRLALPQVTPIRLSLGIALSPEAAAPSKSDGVTFSCYVMTEGRQQELLRHHHAKAEWLDYSFDLTSYAGKTVVIRLQVEPGPKNDPSFDFSYFGDPKIMIGDVPKDQSAMLRRITNSRAYRAVADGNVAKLCNTPQNGVAPSNLLPYKNHLESVDGGWRFVYDGNDCRISYMYRPATGTLDDFLVQLDDENPFAPASEGGATVIFDSPNGKQELPARGGKPVRISSSVEAQSLDVLWEYALEGKPMQIAWTYKIYGKALVVSARCEEPRVSRFSLGDLGPVALRRRIAVPYMPGSIIFLPQENLFVARCLDWTVSHGSKCPEGQTIYEPKTDGTRNTLVETGYLAVSPDVDEVLPNIPHPPSPYLSLLGPRIMLDIWDHAKGTFQGDAENLRVLKDNGVDHVAIISHVWQRYGYDVKLPDHLPANPEYGGDEGMIEFGRAANACGYVWSLHENYIDLYPDAPSYDPAARVLLADGSPSKAWYNSGTRMQSFGLKCNRAMEFARRNSPEIHHRYGTTAGYLDVHPCVPPWHQLDHEAGQPMAAMALAKVQCDKQLCQYLRDTHSGPLFGEGANHFYWAGLCDGVEAQVVGGEDHTPFLDFDLLKLHPQMVNHGMGYYERWFRRGYQHVWGVDTGSMEQIDKYRAQELAYGHAGFVGAAQVNNLQWVVREHHLMHPVQRLYGTSQPSHIRYEVEGQWVTGSAALAGGNTLRQQIQYESGLRLWINWGTQPWQVEGQMLPQWGFLAKGPNTEVFTAMCDSWIVDYAECPEYIFADARTSFTMPYLHTKKDIEPQLRSFKHLGGNAVEVTYEWIVNDTLDDDFHCFVHGVAAAGAEPDHIVFQQDHPLPKPTSQWHKGDRIIDGPYTLQLPDKLDGGTLVIGLYKGSRVPLKGIQEGDNRIEIARCNFGRTGDVITNVRLDKPTELPTTRSVVETDFHARLNPPGTWIDFGKLATDGSAMIRREKDQLVLYPYPRERRFRVRLDMKALNPAANLANVQIRALAAGDGHDLGSVEASLDDGKLAFTVSMPTAGRYVITWK